MRPPPKMLPPPVIENPAMTVRGSDWKRSAEPFPHVRRSLHKTSPAPASMTSERADEALERSSARERKRKPARSTTDVHDGDASAAANDAVSSLELSPRALKGGAVTSQAPSRVA